MDHPLFVLPIATFIILVGFLYWSRRSAKRNQETGGTAAGIGGPNDPLSGATEGIRKPDELRQALETPTGIDARSPPDMRR